MPVKKLQQFLDEHGVKYLTIRHSPAFTAQEIAASAHVSGRELAKTVIIKIDGTMAMAVLPASSHVDFEQLKRAVGARTIQLATELEFQNLFPGCEVGAMPPFGHLYEMDTYVAESLADDEEIAFNAGTHTELIKLTYGDFERLAKPKVVRFAVQNIV